MVTRNDRILGVYRRIESEEWTIYWESGDITRGLTLNEVILNLKGEEQ